MAKVAKNSFIRRLQALSARGLSRAFRNDGSKTKAFVGAMAGMMNEFATWQTKSLAYNAEAMNPNPFFELVSDDTQVIPDGWTILSGSALDYSLVAGVSGTRALKYTSSDGTEMAIISDLFPIAHSTRDIPWNRMFGQCEAQGSNTGTTLQVQLKLYDIDETLLSTSLFEGKVFAIADTNEVRTASLVSSNSSAVFARLQINTLGMGAADTITIDSAIISRARVQPSEVNPSMSNSWTDYSGSYLEAGYRIDSNGMVHVMGTVGGGTPAAGSTGTIFTLPAGFRPANRLIFATITDTGVGRVDILTDGQVRAISGGGTWHSLNGISFLANQ